MCLRDVFFNAHAIFGAHVTYFSVLMCRYFRCLRDSFFFVVACVPGFLVLIIFSVTRQDFLCSRDGMFCACATGFFVLVRLLVLTCDAFFVLARQDSLSLRDRIFSAHEIFGAHVAGFLCPRDRIFGASVTDF